MLAVRAEGPPWRMLRVASINEVKDYPTLLRAVAHLAASGLDVHLDVVGDDTMHGNAQAMARALDLGSRVTFHGFQPTDRLAEFYARAHLHVVSSRHEAAGVVTLEAAAAVWRRWERQSDTSRTGAAIALSPCRHRIRSRSATGVADLLRDRSKREQLAASARRWTLAHDSDWTAGEFERIYREIDVRRSSFWVRRSGSSFGSTFAFR